ncbi:MAG: pyruvate dehydrogenase complex dihydrolipoamide acetyltransferase [Crocinitomicaceae bacterium]|nr:pyruvate dehydrogenase complex dihydrolipoamide acetyltransferase [Crocinitomicaceae bacterium]|tara:strand:+ start:371 stop:1627 length:1257 start_codon:yes stop_codon:yes gene_type:complete
MAEIVRMPKLSDTMTEGVVAEWHKKVGDKVESGDLLAEIETDKATMEFESFQDGTLLYIGVEKGSTAPVDSVLCILGDEGEDYKALLEQGGSGASEEETSTKEEAPKVETTPTPAPKAEPKQEAPKPVPAPVAVATDGKVKASPLAKKVAEDKGINLSQVQGSGEGGRIVKRDVDNFNPATAGAVASYNAGTESYTEEPVSQMRKTIARRLSESKFTAPHFYLTIEIDMDNVIAARKAVNASGEVKISFNDFVIKATASALRKHPKVNSAWLGDKIRYNDHVHIGVAVAVPDGLLVPVVRFADTKSLSQISAEVKTLAGKAKDKKLQPSEWEGNTFSISNLGMFGIEEFTAIINPPDACIMAVGGIIQKPVVKNGQVVPGNQMKVTLSCDHRVVDGATGAEFLNTFKAMLENPVMMLA